MLTLKSTGKTSAKPNVIKGIFTMPESNPLVHNVLTVKRMMQQQYGQEVSWTMLLCLVCREYLQMHSDIAEYDEAKADS
jgi:hypothetical protein